MQVYIKKKVYLIVVGVYFHLHFVILHVHVLFGVVLFLIYYLAIYRDYVDYLVPMVKQMEKVEMDYVLVIVVVYVVDVMVVVVVEVMKKLMLKKNNMNWIILFVRN